MDGVVNGMGVVAIVPARGGSKSVPRKNIRPLNGAPLLAYSIEAGLSACLVDRVIVSTDDEEIADSARGYGAEVPFLRPAALAEDATLDLPVFQHALAWFDAHDHWKPDIVVQLRPTSPLRPPHAVDAAIAMLGDDAEADSVRTVVAASQNPFKMWRIQSDGSMVPLVRTDTPESYNQPRQALPPIHWQTGQVDAVRTATILDKGSMSGNRILALPIEADYAVDIDTLADWERAEWVLTRFRLPLVRPREHAFIHRTGFTR